MFVTIDVIIGFLLSFISTLVVVYPIKKFATLIGAMDEPTGRKIHTKVTPRLGGLAIFIGVAIGLAYLQPDHNQLTAVYLGAIIIIITGVIDDIYQVRPVIKLIGQLLATGILIFSGLVIDRITLPFIGLTELENFSIFFTIIWVIGITNAINLIDGLDGLASGVTTIALLSIFIMAVMDERVVVIYLCVVLIASNIGFLFHNFYPASIYMGDTGALFLGYCIAVISMMGLFKNLTLFSFIIPIIILAVPIIDTLFTIVRRYINGKAILMADNKHIHYQLLRIGFSHRATVLFMYGVAATFGVLAIVFSNASLALKLIISFIILLMIHFFAEVAGVIGTGKHPILSLLKKMADKNKRVYEK